MAERKLVAVRLPARELAAAVTQVRARGDAVLPLAVDAPETELERILAATRPHNLISGSGEVELRDPEPVADGVAAVLLTAGSTGTPKAAELTHDALAYAARVGNERLGARPGDTWLCCVPLNHIAGFGILGRAEHLGQPPLIHGSFDPQRVARAEADLVSLVPTMLARLLDARADLTRFKAILVGGARIPPRFVARAAAAGANVVRSYGMTETCGGVVYDGEPLEGVEVRIDDDRILLRSPTTMRGYRCGPEGFDGSAWFRTSDVGRWVDGRLEVLGRADDVIVTGGEKVVPGEVEAVLLEHPGVGDAIVVGRPDEEWGEKVVAAVEPLTGASVSPDDIRSFIAERLASFKVPKEIAVRDRLPRLASGKIDRSQVR